MMNNTRIEEAAHRAADQAGKLLRHFYEAGVVIRHKGAVDLVTQADLACQEAIVNVLSEAFPKHRFLAEEASLGHDQDLEGPVWVIDPLDGTTNFAHKYPYFGTSIALVIDGVPEFGLIDQPLLRERFVAHKNAGCFLNGKRAHVSQTPSLSNAFLATGFPYDKRESPHNNLTLFSELELLSLCVRRGGAAAIDLAYVACGRFDGFWEGKLKPWDIAAGLLMVQEAGGTVSNYAGEPSHDLFGREVVASNGRIHDDLVSHTKAHRIPLPS